MKLQQLRYICEVAKQDLNVSNAAKVLHTSQPGISKQIRLLEHELGVEIFVRNGKHLTDVTPAGHEILRSANRIIKDTYELKQLAQEYSDEKKGSFSIATSHTQARYVLPPIIKDFRRLYPEVSLVIHQGSPEQIHELVSSGRADFAISTESPELFQDLIMIPCYEWNRSVIVPKPHELSRRREIGLSDIADYPIVTYVYGPSGQSRLAKAFEKIDKTPNVVFSATDTDVIKTYVRMGFGVGIIASMASDSAQDKDLQIFDASHLFDFSIAYIGFRRGTFLRGFMLKFMELFAPHLDQHTVKGILNSESRRERENLFAEFELPSR